MPQQINPMAAKLMTKIQPSPQPETPFTTPSWQWNFVAVGGFAPRERCQSVSTPGEREAAVRLVKAVRDAEAISALNDIDSRQRELDRPLGRVKGVGAELLRREMSACDHDAFLAAQAELAKLRGEALALIKPFLKRLVASFDEALNASAIEAEQRIKAEGIPLIIGNAWTLHSDGVCLTLWFRRVKASKLLSEITADTAVGAVQFFLTSEEHTPFSWV
jgi:hypothetical protein